MLTINLEILMLTIMEGSSSIMEILFPTFCPISTTSFLTVGRHPLSHWERKGGRSLARETAPEESHPSTDFPLMLPLQR